MKNFQINQIPVAAKSSVKIGYSRSLFKILGCFCFLAPPSFSTQVSAQTTLPGAEVTSLKSPFPTESHSVGAMLVAHGSTNAYVRSLRCWVPFDSRKSLGIATFDLFQDALPPRVTSNETGDKVETAHFMAGVDQQFIASEALPEKAHGKDKKENEPKMAEWFYALYPATATRTWTPATETQPAFQKSLEVLVHINPLDSNSDPRILINFSSPQSPKDPSVPQLVETAVLEVSPADGKTPTVKIPLECRSQPRPAVFINGTGN